MCVIIEAGILEISLSSKRKRRNKDHTNALFNY